MKNVGSETQFELLKSRRRDLLALREFVNSQHTQTHI